VAVNPLEVYDRYDKQWSDIGLHLAWLRELAHGTVVEIGVREGISTAALLLGAAHQGGHVYSVDIEDCSQLYQDHSCWTFIKGHSGKDQERIFDELGRRDDRFSIDLLFIDGDHTFDGVMSDLTTYGPWAKVIAVHDVDSGFLGVWEAFISYFRSPHSGRFKSMEVRNASNGMGVLRR
jgi:cephalosporin hydroxylase